MTLAIERPLRINDRRFYVEEPGGEAVERFSCFGGSCQVLVSGSGPAGTARGAALLAKRVLEAWHAQFSRFDQASELSLLNADPRATVPVSAIMARLVVAALEAAEATGGLVEPTLLPQLERAGYGGHFVGRPLPLAQSLALAPPPRPAAPNARSCWPQVTVDLDRRTVTRPPGTRLDSGGIAKGLFGDILATELSRHDAFAIDAAGDLRIGGSARLVREVEVQSPFIETVLHAFELSEGAVATSGIDRRNWLDADGRLAHHLLDPATGTPAFTGVVQATALAPTGVEAEARSKAALLSGPGGASVWLAHGGLVVYDDGCFDVIEASNDAQAR